jgi:hypothetical protein
MTTKEYNAKYYRKHIEKCKRYSSKYRKEHKEELREYKRKYYLEHKERAINASNKRYKEHPEKWKAGSLKKLYRMSLDEYTQLFNHQKGLCAICGKPETAKNKQLGVDHCHKTKNIRGLLCISCNSVLGFANDNPMILLKAAMYLLRGNREIR